MRKLSTVILTECCNKKCAYCPYAEVTSSLDLDLSLLHSSLWVFEKLNSSIIYLTGGEPGIVKEHVLDLLFSIEQVFAVTTNGLFLKKEYHKKYDNVRKIQYHVDLNDVCFQRFNDSRVVYSVVITHSNIGQLESFLKHNSDIQFHINLMQVKDSKFDGLRLEAVDVEKVIELGAKYNNIYPERMNMLVNYSKNLNSTLQDQYVNACRNRILYGLAVNLPRQTILACCRTSYTDPLSSIPLTDVNLNSILQAKTPLSLFPGSVEMELPCDTCFRIKSGHQVLDMALRR